MDMALVTESNGTDWALSIRGSETTKGNLNFKLHILCCYKEIFVIKRKNDEIHRNVYVVLDVYFLQLLCRTKQN